jgi:hypothetical protein
VIVTAEQLRELARQARTRTGSIRLTFGARSANVPWSQIAAELEDYASRQARYDAPEGSELGVVLAQIRAALSSSSTPTAAPASSSSATPAEEYERAGRAVQRFLAVGVVPLIAAGTANDPQAWPGIVALRANGAAWTAIRAAEESIRQQYERARATYATGDVVRARNEMVLAAQHAARMAQLLLQVAPAAGRHLAGVVGATAWEVLVDVVTFPARVAEGFAGVAKAVGAIAVLALLVAASRGGKRS